MHMLSHLFQHIRTFATDNYGFTSVLMAFAIMVLTGFAALAIDVGSLYVKRSQLQSAADAAALAGASSLVSKGTYLSDVANDAVAYARVNLRDEDEPEKAVDTNDVTFLWNGYIWWWNPNQVEVTVKRTLENQNAFSLFFGKTLGIDSADIIATARAQIIPICSTKCVKPFTVPAKFTWNDCVSSGSYRYNGKLDPGSPEEMASINVIGYGEDDIGTRITLKFGKNEDAVVPSNYNPITLPPVNKGNPVTGASAYRDNIAGCDGSNAIAAVSPGDTIQTETGNMTGPTSQGVQTLINKDPSAYWSTCAGAIVNSLYDDPLASPRVALIAFYDPREPLSSGRTTTTVYQVGAVFIEGITGKGDVTARFIRANPVEPDPVDGCDDCLLVTTRMVKDTSRGGNKIMTY